MDTAHSLRRVLTYYDGYALTTTAYSHPTLTRLVIAARNLWHHQLAAEGGRQCEGGADLGELVVHHRDVPAHAHAAGGVQHLVREVELEGEHAPRGVVVLGRVYPHARLAQPVPLARRATVLEGRVDRVCLPPVALRELSHEVVVPPAEESQGQYTAHHLALVRPEEARVGEALEVAWLPLVAREAVELSLVPSRLRLLADHLAPLGYQRQRRGAEEHVADVEGGVDRTVRLEALVVGGVGEVVGGREEACVGPARHESERLA
eukprot:scaffold16675_cov58-Phaeocystis_antarctica.AAC.2